MELRIASGFPPPCRNIRSQLKNGRHDSSDADVLVIIAITGHGSTPPKGGTFCHLSTVTQSPVPINNIFQLKREPTYLSGGLLSTY
ncbi:hypothetical protein AVEN_256106-1 [Araneus ventricosus]|uniref:Uncharacterized protein n=1 Tax=Araneus ventricosus TaxID=182803 RepID=A0A4Y2D5G9_ARAVE|nr:hypothetical protein AVEN_256106-1 [Araneus ventricosus]